MNRSKFDIFKLPGLVQICIVLRACIVTSTESVETTSAKPGQNFTDDALVDDTFRLITEGDRLISLNDNISDIVLVIGNTGAGKTTITKFLAEVNNLESYDAGDRLLIRDNQQKISEKGTIVSKTIFPDLIVDNSTQTAFYDLPGFSDTRNASVEIANAWFIKKVADHAQEVKLLFIVNYFSLRNATKVESSRSQAKIISGIAAFLLRTKSDLQKVLNDESKRQAASDLIDAMLTKDSEGNYIRISYFKQPEEVGPLTSLPEVMQQKFHIENVLYNSTHYVPKSSEDFGFSVSPAAKLVTSKVAVKINQKITSIMVSIGEKMSSQFQGAVQTSPLESIGTFVKEQGRLHKMVEQLSSNVTSTTRPEFFKNFLKILNRLNLTASPSLELLELQQRQDNLKFFEQITGNKFQANIPDWVNPIAQAVEDSANAITQRATVLKNKMQNDTIDISNQIYQSFSKKLEQFEGNKHKSLQAYESYTQKLSQMNKQISKVKTVNSFTHLLQVYLKILDEDVSTINLVVLHEDLKLDRRSILKLLPWVLPFEQLLSKLWGEMHEFQVQVLINENKAEMGKMSQDLEALNDSFMKVRAEQDKRTKKMKKDMEDNMAAMNSQLATMQANHQRQYEILKEMIRQNNEIIRQLEKERNRPWYKKIG
ncbi:unnamed protein product [Allacma fusca]|uniref:G domain-containing protein n=1 Tax=Allacma fusca TaxID=39272 RepID=A0A8J2LI10_9HEXA|nr:unnamed protein product [Allacma fusca]